MLNRDFPRGETRLRRVLRWAYLPWAWLVYAPGMLLLTGFWASLAWLLSYLGADRAHGCAQPWARMLTLLNFTRIRVRGRENVTPGQAYVVMSNHQSHFDVLALIAKPPTPIRWTIKAELRKIPIFGPACAKAGYVYLDRSNRQRAIESLRAARPLFDRGNSLMIFPEGTRSADGNLLAFKKGGFMVALDAELPILPVTVTGTRRILPANTLQLMPGLATITIHPPIDAAAYGIEGRDELMAAVRAAIASGLEPMRLDAQGAPADEPAAEVKRAAKRFPSEKSGDPLSYS